MKNTKENISLYEVSKLKQQQKLLLDVLNVTPNSPLPSIVVTTKAYKNKMKSKPPSSSSDKISETDAILIGDKSNYHTPPSF